MKWQRAKVALAAGARKALAHVPHALCDLAGYAGAVTIAYGCYLVAPALGFIVAGVVLIAMSMLIGRRLNANDAGNSA